MSIRLAKGTLHCNFIEFIASVPDLFSTGHIRLSICEHLCAAANIRPTEQDRTGMRLIFRIAAFHPHCLNNDREQTWLTILAEP